MQLAKEIVAHPKKLATCMARIELEERNHSQHSKFNSILQCRRNARILVRGRQSDTGPQHTAKENDETGPCAIDLGDQKRSRPFCSKGTVAQNGLVGAKLRGRAGLLQTSKMLSTSGEPTAIRSKPTFFYCSSDYPPTQNEILFTNPKCFSSHCDILSNVTKVVDKFHSAVETPHSCCTTPSLCPNQRHQHPLWKILTHGNGAAVWVRAARSLLPSFERTVVGTQLGLWYCGVYLRRSVLLVGIACHWPQAKPDQDRSPWLGNESVNSTVSWKPHPTNATSACLSLWLQRRKVLRMGGFGCAQPSSGFS